MFIDVNKTSEELTAEMLANVPDNYQKSVGYILWDCLRAIGIVIMELWNALSYIAGLDDLSKFNYDDLVRFVRERRGIEAREESKATGFIKVTSGEGNITKGDLFETPDKLQFQALESIYVSEGGLFEAECLTAGPVGNVPAGTITVIPKTIQGLVKISNPEPFTGGYDKESKESIIERYKEDLKNPITSGNIYHYKKWAKEVTGVGEVDVKPLWNGDNTVKVIITDTDTDIADSQLVEAVQNYIDPYTLDEFGNKIGWGCGNGQAPIGAYCTVESATGLDINISVGIKLKTGTTKETAEESIRKKIKEYLHSIVFDDEVTYVSYAYIGSCILLADGIADYKNLLVNGATDNVAILNNETSREVAVLSALNTEVW